jgi:hypothetical protein
MLLNHCWIRSLTAAAAVSVVAACGDATATARPSTFTADVRGATNERITGSAIASFGGDWLRQNALQVTLPNGATFSGVALSASTGAIISFFRSGTELPVGTYAVGVAGGAPAFLKGGFSGGYAIRRTDGLQLFLADSGTVTISGSGNRVSGTFMLYFTRYDVLPLPTASNAGQPLTPLSSGESPLTITGSFDAERR